MTSIRSLSLGLVVVWTTQLVTSTTAYDGLHGYEAINPEVYDLANIARDLHAMHEELKHFKRNEEGMERAHNIYKFGGFSRSVCTLYLEEGLEEALEVGATVSGTSVNGQEITAVLEAHHKKGDKRLRMLYNQDVPCHVGGLPEERQETHGCFESKGEVMYGENNKYSAAYSYHVSTGNTNERTIHDMSVNAGRKFRHGGQGNQPFYHDFQKFVDYYGEPDFGDRMITAAMRAGRYSFPEGEFEFKDSSKKALQDFIELFASYLNVGLFIISELENALEKCADHCQHGDCHHAAIHALDAAVAFYVGSLQAEDEHGNGNMLYGLANEMCHRYRTCGPKGDQETGIARANYDIFEEFKEMQDNLMNDQCVDARKNKEAIIKHIFIPMVQGFKFAVYRRHVGKDHAWGKEYQVEDAAPFAAATLPLLAYCKMDAAKQIQVNFDPGHFENTEDLVQIDDQIDEHLECMGMCCRDIGGLWDHSRKKYHHNAHPCRDTWDHCFDAAELEAQGEKSHKWMLYVFLVAVVLTAILYRRRLKEIKRRKRAEATGEYEDDSESSVESVEEMHAFT